MLNFKLQPNLLAKFIADEFECHIPRGAGKVVAGSVEINGGKRFVASLNAKANVFFLEDVGTAKRCHVLRVKNWRRISHATGFEQRKFLEVILVQVGNIDPHIETQSGNKTGDLQFGGGGGVETSAEKIEVFTMYTQPGGHVMPAKGTQQIGTLTQRLHQRQTFDAAPAAVTLAGLIKTDNQGRTMKTPAKTGGNNAHNAVMPSLATNDNGAIPLGIKRRLERRDSSNEHSLLQFLPLTIEGV